MVRKYVGEQTIEEMAKEMMHEEDSNFESSVHKIHTEHRRYPHSDAESLSDDNDTRQ